MPIEKISVKQTGPFIKENQTLLKGKDFTDIIPLTCKKSRINMKIKGESPAVANAIRRTMLEELEVKILTFDKDDMVTDDEYLIWNNVQTQIKAMRIMQDTPDDARFYLDVTNKKALNQMIRASQIKRRGKGELPFNKTFRIITLRKGHYLNIKNIKVVKGFGFEDAMFSATAGIAYRQTDTVPYERGTGVSSMVSECKNYELDIDLNGNIDPRYLIEATLDNIKRRVKMFLDDMDAFEKLNKPGENYLSDILEITFLEDIVTFKLKDETHTLANLIRYFVYQNDPDIPLVNYKIPHQTIREAVVRISSKNPVANFSKALDSAYKKFEKLEENVQGLKF